MNLLPNFAASLLPDKVFSFLCLKIMIVSILLCCLWCSTYKEGVV